MPEASPPVSPLSERRALVQSSSMEGDEARVDAPSVMDGGGRAGMARRNAASPRRVRTPAGTAPQPSLVLK